MTRGVLYPARLPTFHRLPPPDAVPHLVRWFWIPEWDIAPGRSSRQHVIAFPASNLVVEVEGVSLAGPTTRASYRDLTGRGWAVGAMLRPAALPALTPDPASHRDAVTRLDLPDLHEAVTSEMTGDADRSGRARRERAAAAFARWLLDTMGPRAAMRPDAQLANDLADLIDGNPEVLRLQDAASRLGVSTRTVQRLARTYIGVSPGAMIRRRRLQEAAQRVRAQPDTDLSAVAADLGYADHAHLTHDFRTVLGFTPSTYRADLR